MIALKVAIAGLFVLSGQTGSAVAETIIHAGTLIADADTQPKQKQSIVIENGKVVRILDGFIDAPGAVDLSCCVVVPGFIDMHTHITLENAEDDPRAALLITYWSTKSQVALAAAGRARDVLNLGFTTIRNLGDPANVSRDLRDAIARGQVVGPRMIVAGGSQIGVSGGDYDPGALRLSKDAEALVPTDGQCDGPAACRAVVRSAFRRGADVIKLRLSSVSLVNPKVKRLEHEDEIAAIVETAHDLGMRVAAHASTADRATMAIAAGVDTIEHAPLSAQNIAAMRKANIAYTPTLQASLQLGPMIKRMAGIDYDDAVLRSAKAAYDRGIPVLFGSDLGAISVADMPAEFERLAEAGIPLDGVLKSATSAAAAALGMSDQIGAIRPGLSADIVAMRKNPLADVGAYQTVVFVMKGGRIYKNENGANGE